MKEPGWEHSTIAVFDNSTIGLLNHDGNYVLYWCQMFRRLHFNHALDYAVHMATELKKPLVIFEALKLNYPWASARFHQFLLEGMSENLQVAKTAKLNYWPFIETAKVKGHGLVKKLCNDACLLITDDYPQFIIPAHNRAISMEIDIPVTAIDGNSMVPLALLGEPTKRAFSLRGKIHKLFGEAWGHRAVHEHDFKAPLTKSIDPPFKLWEPANDLAAWGEEVTDRSKRSRCPEPRPADTRPRKKSSIISSNMISTVMPRNAINLTIQLKRHQVA